MSLSQHKSQLMLYSTPAYSNIRESCLLNKNFIGLVYAAQSLAVKLTVQMVEITGGENVHLPFTGK